MTTRPRTRVLIEAGHVAYDPDGNHGTGQMCSPTSRLSQLAVINPATLAVTHRVSCPAATTTTA